MWVAVDTESRSCASLYISHLGRFTAGEVLSKSRLHISVGHMTVMADLSFFGVPDGEGDVSSGAGAGGLDGALARLQQLTHKVCCTNI